MAGLAVGLALRHGVHAQAFKIVDQVICGLEARVYQLAYLLRQTQLKQVENQWGSQVALPSLGVPHLSGSIEKIRTIAKLELTPGNYKIFCEKAEEFRRGAGVALQSMLRAYSLSKTNWIDEFWEKGIYLCSRECPIESSTWIGFAPKTPDLSKFQSPQMKMFVRAGVLLHLLGDYKKELEEGNSKENMVFTFGGKGKKGHPIDASKCKRVFGTYRKPQEKMDGFIENPKATHIVVLIKGQIFSLELYESGSIKSPEQLVKDLEHIFSSAVSSENDIGFLTTQKREVWAKDYEKLKKSNPNEYHKVESALGAISFEETDSWGDRKTAALHGFQTKANRNFDLSFQICFEPGGDFYAICSHAAMDATHIAPMIEHCGRKESAIIQELVIPYETTKEDLVPLQFELDLELTQKIQALKEGEKLNPGLQIAELHFTTFDQKHLQRAGHPDAVMQMAFQLAYAYLQNEENVNGINTYEAVSMRHFKGWRTAQAHPRSEASEAFVKVARNANSSKLEVLKALREAANVLSKDQKEVAMGNPFDRHLFALYCLARRNDTLGTNSAPAFLEEVMTKLTKYSLSTSQLPQEFGEGGIFGPGEENGYGIFYQINQAGVLKVWISSKNPSKRAEDLKNCLIDALNFLKPVLDLGEVRK